MKAKDKTRFFFFDKGRSDFVEIPIYKIGYQVEEEQIVDNWFFAQMEATIRTAFMSHNLSVPEYVFIDRRYRKTKLMEIFIVRHNIYDELEALNWYNNRIFVEDELQIQARANSDEDFLDFVFKIF